ncbi:hypothetical protein ACLKA7_005669 [Drosophila subpalustris]
MNITLDCPRLLDQHYVGSFPSQTEQKSRRGCFTMMEVYLQNLKGEDITSFDGRNTKMTSWSAIVHRALRSRVMVDASET